MKNSIKYLRLLSLYGILSLVIYSLGNSQAFGLASSADKHKELAKDYTKDYQGLVRSSLANINFIQQNGKVVKPILDFLALYNIKHQGTLRSINKALQDHFMKKPNLENWQLKDTEQDRILRPSALKLLKKLDFVNAIPQLQVDVDYFLLFGAKLPAVKRRFDDFLAQYKSGTLRCKNIVFLGELRKLEPDEIQDIKLTLGDGYGNFLQGLNKKATDLTEMDMMHFIWETNATSPLKRKYQKSKNLFFVNCMPSTYTANYRPTTATTIQAWLKEYIPKPGSYHANVEKPYAIRMEKILRLELEKYSKQLINVKGGFSITWNSPESNKDLLLAIYKDELARAFAQEYDLKKYLGVIKD